MPKKKNKYKNIPSNNEVDLDHFHSIEDDTTEELPPPPQNNIQTIPDHYIQDLDSKSS